jgi:hypothetical protein
MLDIPKKEIFHIPSFPCKQESSLLAYTEFWIPAFTGMTIFYETTMIRGASFFFDTVPTSLSTR